jgi:dTDP-4-amino-4,6-dideoxygalactose transaminase
LIFSLPAWFDFKPRCLDFRKNAMIWKVPLADIALGPEEIAAVTAVLQSGWLSMGPQTQQFEARFAEYLGAKHAGAVANGTAALHLACELLGLAAGDEVLCPALTFVASANAILYTGARPVFVDINGPGNLNLSPADAAKKITAKTKAILVVHYAGYPCDMDAWCSLAAAHNLRIIEDCAHAPGGVYFSRSGPRRLGTIGDIGCFSFFSNKNMTTGEGGMIVTNDDDLAAGIKTARSHGMTSLTWDRHQGHSFSYDVVARGYNYRLDEMRAALGIVQLQHLEARNTRRRQLALRYQDELSGLEPLAMPFLEAPSGSTHHIFPVLLTDAARRPALMAGMAQIGIQTSVHYPPVHNFSYYRQLWPAGYDHRVPHTEDVARREVTLPLFPTMTIDQLQAVVSALKECLNEL